METKKYQKLAAAFAAMGNCMETGNDEWLAKWEDEIEQIIDSLPHGSGIDGDTAFDYYRSTSEKLIIHSEYHAMDQNGSYDGWINFKLTVTPSLQFGMNLNISGNFGKYQDIKDYLHEIFDYALKETID